MFAHINNIGFEKDRKGKNRKELEIKEKLLKRKKNQRYTQAQKEYILNALKSKPKDHDRIRVELRIPYSTYLKF
jgi:hypothetical protein